LQPLFLLPFFSKKQKTQDIGVRLFVTPNLVFTLFVVQNIEFSRFDMYIFHKFVSAELSPKNTQKISFSAMILCFVLSV